MRHLVLRQALFEVDRFWEINGHPGALRVLYAASRTNSARHRDMIATGFDETAFDAVDHCGATSCTLALVTVITTCCDLMALKARATRARASLSAR